MILSHPRFAAVSLLAGLLAASSALGQRLLPEVKPEFLVNTFTAGNQTHPAVAASTSGTVWVVWFEAGQPPYGIKARRFDSSGSPLGPELWVHTGAELTGEPRIGATADGGFVLVWASSPDVWARRFDANGAPVGDELRVDPEANFADISSPGVAVASDGSFFVAWLRSNGLADAVLAQRFDPQGQHLGAVQEVSSGLPRAVSGLRVAGAADGGLLTVWRDLHLGGIAARRYDGPSGAWSAAVQVDGPLSSYDAAPAAVLASDGSATVVWITNDAVLGRHLNAAGAPTGSEIKVGENPADLMAPAVAADGNGNAFVVWSDRTLTLQGRLLKGDLPFGDTFPVADPAFPATEPAAAATPSGGFAVVWSSGHEYDTPTIPLPTIPGKDGNALGVVARLFAPAPCAAGSEVLCLGPDGRFEVRVDWKNPFNGQTGTGRVRPLTADTGAFWFFNDQNLELMIKVLDGRTVNGHFWVYYGSLSNVEYTLTLTDTKTGVQRSYHNAPFQFASRADVEAFADAAALGAEAEPLAASPSLAVAAAPIVGCLPVSAGPPTSLCLASGHFTVSVEFKNPRIGIARPATAVPITTDTGAFWFFSETNLELMVKVLDGRAVNGHFWVFYGALSDVEYTITVSHPETGEVRTYHNPKGTLASRADTQAF